MFDELYRPSSFLRSVINHRCNGSGSASTPFASTTKQLVKRMPDSDAASSGTGSGNLRPERQEAVGAWGSSP